MPEESSKTPKPKDASFDDESSVDTLPPPPREDVKRVLESRGELDWDEIVRLHKRKAKIWIKRRSGLWNIGRIVNIDEKKRKIMVRWDEPGSIEEQSKCVSFDTFKKWWKEAPILPKQRIEDDGDDDDYESR